MAATFLLLELLDPTVNAFLWTIREVLAGEKKVRTPIHITVRGPYEGDVPRSALASARDALQHDVLRIAGVGRFSNQEDQVVFFRVDSPNLRSVWWKPSFPIEQFGFAPHISVYRGNDAEFADRVQMFLEDEHVELFCAEHRLVWYESGQPNLLSPLIPSVGDLDDLTRSERVDFALLDRLRDTVESYRARKRFAGMIRHKRT
jgi:hypothetical protein